MRRAGPGLVTALGLALWPTVAAATWSIVAVDPNTQAVGVAVASCVEAPFGTTILPYVAGLAPGHGALAAQALYDQDLRDEALAVLLRGATPQAVIDAVLAGDPQSATRQYGVVTLDLQTAAFTGANADDWAGQLQGRGVSVQGNILYGPEVVADALAAFEVEAPACPWTLADRLMLALEAGAARGGDNRCSEEQAALAAALRVALPGDDPETPSLDLRIPSQPQGGDAPVALLRIAYDEWRRANPPDASRCDAGTGGSDDTGASTSAGGTSGPSATDEGIDTRAATTITEPDPPVIDGSTTASPNLTTSAGSTPTTSGCRCRSTREASWVPLLLLVALPRRRSPPTRSVSRP
jgi:MYXO-CTERM domain-containing protein